MVSTILSRFSFTSLFQKRRTLKPAAARRTSPLTISQEVPWLYVLRSIDFNDEACFQAGEVGNIAFPRNLTAKMKTLPFQSAKMNPEFYFLRRHRLAQVPRDFIGHYAAPQRCAIPPRHGEGGLWSKPGGVEPKIGDTRATPSGSVATRRCRLP